MRLFLVILMSFLISSVSFAMPKQIDIDDSDIDDIKYDGIDVSSYQKDIDWSATAKDDKIKFVYVKATEGATLTSRHYRINIENARKQGIKVGSYHFLRPTSSIQDQFNNFTNSVKKSEQDLVPLIDIETKRGWTPKQLRDSLKLFADLLEEHYGCRPMIYTSSSFYNDYLAPDFDSYPLFIARYAQAEPQLSGDAKWTLWQFSERGQVQGIDARVDLCRFNKGCSVSDILIRNKKIKPQQPNSDVVESVDKVKRVPKINNGRSADNSKSLSKKEKKELEKKRKEQEETQKRAQELAKEREKKQQELAKEKQKKEQELNNERQEQQKRIQKELQKKAEEEKKQQEKEEKKRQEKQRKDSLKAANAAANKANSSSSSQGKKLNQSSADNSSSSYPTRRRSNTGSNK